MDDAVSRSMSPLPIRRSAPAWSKMTRLSASEETAFVRVLVLPREWEGKRTIRYVDPADEEKPKLQRARIYLEHLL